MTISNLVDNKNNKINFFELYFNIKSSSHELDLNELFYILQRLD